MPESHALLFLSPLTEDQPSHKGQVTADHAVAADE
jgi:hypothetical protein